MPRGYRCIILAAVGWLTLSALHPQPSVTAEQTQADARVGDALSNNAATYAEQAKRVTRTPKREPCGPAEYKSDDDLCAQWKAADAADKSAWWAAFAGWFGGLSFFGVLAAIGLTIQSNRIARDTAKRQLRAYLSVIPKGITEGPNDTSGTVVISLKNNGQTPAYDIRIAIATVITDFPIGDDLPNVPSEIMHSDGVIGGGSKTHFYRHFDSVDMQYLERVRDEEAAFLVHGTVWYRDIFNEERKTHFCHHYRGKELDAGSAKTHLFGNSAT
jgi:hypothetical protein